MCPAVYVLLILFGCRKSHANCLISIGITTTYYLTSNLTNIVENIFTPNETVVIIYQNQQHIFSLKISNPVLIENYSEQTNCDDSKRRKYKNYIITIEEFDYATNFVRGLQRRCTWNSRGFYLVLVKSTISISNVFDTFWKNKMLYTVLVQYADLIKIFSGSPYGKNVCGKYTQATEILSLPNKLFKVPRSLQGCNFKIARLEKVLLPMPFNGNTSVFGVLDGSTKIIADALELTLSIVSAGLETEKKIMSGKIPLNQIFTEYELYLSPPNRRNEVYKDFDLSKIYFFDDYIWVIAKPKQYSNSFALTLVFSVSVWISLFVVYICCAILFWIVIPKEHRNVLDSFFKTFGISLSQYFFTRPNRISLSILKQLYIYFLLVVYHCFQGQLSSILTNSGHPPGINTVDEMAVSDATPILYANIIDDYKNKDYPILKKIINKAIPVREDLVERIKLLLKGNISTPLYKISLEYNLDSYKRYLNNIGSDYLLNMEACYTFKKNHPFLDSFNKIITIIHEHGIQHKLIRNVIKRKFRKYDEPKKVLSFDHVEGAFFILTIGYIAASSVFIAEIAYKCF